MRAVILIIVCAGVLLLAPAVSAESSANATLEQHITPLKCSYTTVATGRGVTHDSTCPDFDPTIEQIDENGGRPIITGIYDAVHTAALRVRLANVWYVLGSDAELTTNGNVWVLDLSALANALPAGKYTIIVEAEGDDGKIRRAETAMTVTPSSAPAPSSDEKDPIPITDDKPKPGMPVQNQEGTCTPIVPLAAMTVGAAGAMWFFIIAKRRHRKKHDDE